MFISRIEDPRLYEYTPPPKRYKVNSIEKSSHADNSKQQHDTRKESFAECLMKEMQKRRRR